MSIWGATGTRAIDRRNSSRINRRSSGFGGINPVDPVMFNAAQGAASDREKRDSRKKPIEWIFDRLSTGQYLSANLFDSIITSIGGEKPDYSLWDIAKGSVTGELDKSFSDVLAKHWESTTDKWFPDRERKFGGNIDTASVLGFVMDVVIDPLNFISGPTRLASKAATEYANHAVLSTIKSTNILDDLAKKANIAPSVIRNLMEQNPKKLERALQKQGFSNMAQRFSEMWKNAYHEGLNMSTDEMVSALRGLYINIQSDTQKNLVRNTVKSYRNKRLKPYQEIARNNQDEGLELLRKMDPEEADQIMDILLLYDQGAIPNSAEAFGLNPQAWYEMRRQMFMSDDWFQSQSKKLNDVIKGDAPIDSLDEVFRESFQEIFGKDVITRLDTGAIGHPGLDISGEAEPFGNIFESVLSSADFIENLDMIAEGAGQVGFRVLNKEILKHSRRLNPKHRGFDIMERAIRKGVHGSKIGDIIWHIQENTAIGSLRRMFQIQNPYQKLLHWKEIDNKHQFTYNIEKVRDRVEDIMEPFKDKPDIVRRYFMDRAAAQEFSKPVEMQADLYARYRLGLGEYNVRAKAERVVTPSPGGPGIVDPEFTDVVKETALASGPAPVGRMFSAEEISPESLEDVIRAAGFDRLSFRDWDYQREVSIPANMKEAYNRYLNEYRDIHRVDALEMARRRLFSDASGAYSPSRVAGDNQIGQTRPKEIGRVREPSSPGKKETQWYTDVDGKAYRSLEEAEYGNLNRLHESVDSYMKEMDVEEREWMKKGLMESRESLYSYLPLVYRKMASGGKKKASSRVMDSSVLHQNKGPYEAINTERNILMGMFGIDEGLADDLIMKNNMSGISTDLDDVLLTRAAHHEMVRYQVTTMEAFREFGFNVMDSGSISPEIMAMLQDDQRMSRLGLEPVKGAMSGVFTRGGDNGYKYYFDQDVRRTIDRVSNFLQEPGDIQRLLSHRYLPWWKAVATSTPGFHMRNMISNGIMVFTGHGMKAFDPKYITEGFTGAAVGLKGIRGASNMFQNHSDGAMRLLLNRKHGGYTLQELIVEGQKRGIISKSSMAKSSDDPIRNLLSKQDIPAWQKKIRAVNLLDPESAYYQGSANVGAFFESGAKFQSFLIEIDDLSRAGLTSKNEKILELAERKAKQLLIDYDDLSQIEKRFMKPIAPFYTWVRKNIGNQLAAISDPQMWSRLSIFPKSLGAISYGTDMPKEDIPDYMRDAGFVSAWDINESLTAMFWPNIPIMDLNILPWSFSDKMGGGPKFEGRELFNNIIQMSHPGLKFIREMASNYDSFREREIKPTEAGKRYWGVLTKMPRVTSVLDTILGASDENGIGLITGIDSEGVPQVNGRVLRAFETLFPLANTLERYLQLVESGEAVMFNTSVIEDAVEKATGAKDPQEKVEKALRALSFGFGIKMDVLDRNEARFWKASEIYQSAQDKRRAQQELVPYRQFKKTDWENRQRNTFRRLGIW